MPFFERAADFLTDRVTPRLAVGHGPRNQPTRAELEVQAEQELQAQIDLGRPGPEESVRRGPAPEWAVVRHARPSRPLEVVKVRLDALGMVPPVASTPAQVVREPIARESGAPSA